jgi:hypothetical protein
MEIVQHKVADSQRSTGEDLGEQIPEVQIFNENEHQCRVCSKTRQCQKKVQYCLSSDVDQGSIPEGPELLKRETDTHGNEKCNRRR